MSVLILHRGSLEAAPYDRWLREYQGDLLLLASREHLEALGERVPAVHGYTRVEALDGYHVSGRVEARALSLAREYQVEYVVAAQERDMERAAQLREILDLPGQRLESAVPFRDKLVMKSLVRDAGLPVAPFADVECAVDVVAFAEQHGFPMVLKPRNGGGSIGLRIVESREDLDRYLAEEFDLYLAGQPNLMAEAYVPGKMCHVDGLVVDGEVVFACPSQYQYALATFAVDHGPRLDVTLDPGSALAQRLLAFTDGVLGALPAPSHFPFHAEVFHTPDDELLLCEVACRPGGAGIRDVMATLYGIDPMEYWMRAQVGLDLPGVDGGARMTPRCMAGQLLLMKRPGRVVEVPPRADFPWIEKQRTYVHPGQELGPSTYSGDFMASFVVSAPTRTECETRMHTLAAWYSSHLKIATPASLPV